MSTLTAADFVCIAKVLGLRLGVTAETPDFAPHELTVESTTGLRRTAEIAHIAAQHYRTSPMQKPIILASLICQLRLEGYQLLAPQGVVVGIVHSIAADDFPTDRLTAWLEDRSIKI